MVNFFLSGIVIETEHPFYLSVCEINYHVEEQTLKLAIRIFSDNLEEAVNEVNTDKAIAQYLAEKLKIEVNEKKATFSYLGKEVKNDVTWSYLEVKNVKEVKSLTITNTVLFELYNSQKNIVHIKIGEKKKSLLLEKGEEKGEAQF